MCHVAAVGQPLLRHLAAALLDLVDIVHFAEAGPVAPDALVDIAFIEGSVSTPDDRERIVRIRSNATTLVTIGACATAGGVQALRGLANAREWVAAVYASPAHIASLDTSTPIAQHVKVDLELWGCPVSGRQVQGALRALLWGVVPPEEEEKVCLECKRRAVVCVMVARNMPCMGPVTRTGCGALCPAFGRDCYACQGPAENPNTGALSRRLAGIGLLPADVARRFLFINNGAPRFRAAGLAAQDRDHG